MIVPKIAILDSGLNYDSNIDKLDNIHFLKSYEYSEYIHSTDDGFGHGTQCYRLMNKIVSNGEYYIFKVLNDYGKANAKSLIEALKDLSDIDIHIINLSISLIDFRDSESIEKLNDICQYLRDQGKIIVSSLKNNFSELSFPAAFTSVIGVRGAWLNDEFSYWFNKDYIIQSVTDITPVFLPNINGKWSFFSGNSKAAVLMSSLIAKIIGNNNDFDYYYTLKVLEENTMKKYWGLKDVDRSQILLNQEAEINGFDLDPQLVNEVKLILKDCLNIKNDTLELAQKNIIFNNFKINSTTLINIMNYLEEKLNIKISYEKVNFNDFLNLHTLCTAITDRWTK